MYYFAYGSNMNRERARLRIPGARDLGRAYLEGWRVVLRETTDIEQEPGATAEGVLYRVSATEVAALDAFEGYPKVYERIKVKVTYSGRKVEAFTYVMQPMVAWQRELQCAKPEYRMICYMGALEHGVATGPFEICKKPDFCNICHVAVYGTLRAGEANERVPSVVIRRDPCTLRGWLYDTGWGFPTFVPDPDGQEVQAEVLMTTVSSLLGDFDRLEGYPDLYDRQRLEVDLGSKGHVAAWVYVMPSLPRGAKRIKSGDWKNRK